MKSTSGDRGAGRERAGRKPSGEALRGGDPGAERRAVEALARLAEAFDRRRRQLARGLELTDAQLRVLEDIARDDFMPSLFARRRACSAAAVSRTLRQLQDRGLVEAAIGAGDARQRAYSLTARGGQLVERLRDRRQAALDAIWRDLPHESLETFARLGVVLAERMDAYADEQGAGQPRRAPPHAGKTPL